MEQQNIFLYMTKEKNAISFKKKVISYGNNHIVSDATGTIIQSNQYYAFGMLFAESTGQDKQDLKYNGKELDRMHGLNWYDYSARYYDPAIPRFTSVDPMAEKYYSWSPYAYVANNPMKFIDPDGREKHDEP